MKRIRWEIDVDARTPREAARKALAIQRDQESIATVFDVQHNGKTVRIDLSEDTVVVKRALRRARRQCNAQFKRKEHK